MSESRELSRVARTGVLIGALAVASVVAYATYFDYKRRNDPTFRKKLRKEKKRVDKSRAQSASSMTVDATTLRNALERVRKEPVPDSQDEREQYFMSQVAMGEQLASQGSEYHLPAAMSFYRALRVYPSPVELIMIYQKTVPEPIFKLVMEMTNLDVAERIEGYYTTFPPKAMNVIVEPRDQGHSMNDGKTVTKNVLVAAKDFKVGEVLFKENPLVASVSNGVVGYCAYCFKKIDQGEQYSAIHCSENCEILAESAYQRLLFSSDPPFPEAEATYTEELKIARASAQNTFLGYLQKHSTIYPLLVARFIASQVSAETVKLQKGISSSASFLPDYVTQSDYSMYDHIQRLRFVALAPPDEEVSLLREVLGIAVPGLESFVTEERYATIKAQLAYNAIGVTFAEDTLSPAATFLNSDQSRNPYSTSQQVGSGLYCVSSYISHSCNPSVRPTFPMGTSEVHMVANRDIKRDEELSMAWVDVQPRVDESASDARVRRRTDLERGWHFSCMCDRCKLEGGEDLESSLINDESQLGPELERAERRRVSLAGSDP